MELVRPGGFRTSSEDRADKPADVEARERKEPLSGETIHDDLCQKFVYGAVKCEKLNRYLLGGAGSIDGGFEFGLGWKVWAGDINVGIISM